MDKNRVVMQKYELMLLLNPNTMDEVDDFIDGLKKVITDNKGDLVDTKLLGKRQLAYPINNMNYANYVHLDVNVEPETLNLLEEKFRYDQNVFRHLTVKLTS
ncbi:MAG: 30S ribosomal protein S6 [Gammaproteobacteria bacterium]|jgi:small subunit ribosomal protein S6|nr:30S ribosomal protein S6 [Gammaproteobacteria bacterium]